MMTTMITQDITPPAIPLGRGITLEAAVPSRERVRWVDLSSMDNVSQLGQMVAKSEFFPAYKGKGEDAALAIMIGQTIGLSWVHSLLNIAIIKGAPRIWGDSMLAVCKVAPDYEYCHEEFDAVTMTASCETKRKNESARRATFSKEDAIRATLWGRPGPWTSYPQRMLQMRARTFALRDTFPHVIQGMLTVEEMMDVPPQEGRPALAAETARALPSVADTLKEKLQKPRDVVTPSTLATLLQMIATQRTKTETIGKWTRKAGVNTVAELTETQATAVIAMLKRKEQKESAG